MNELVRYCQWCGSILNGLDGALKSHCDQTCRDEEAAYCSDYDDTSFYDWDDFYLDY